MPFRPRSFFRPLVVVAAWLCLVTQLSAVSHFLIVEHVRCAEHGELVHAHEAHHAAAPQAQARQASPNRLFTPSEESEDHDHDHCLVGSEQKETSPSQECWQKLQVTRTQFGLPRLTQTHGVIATRIYAFAPKTSPPA